MHEKLLLKTAVVVTKENECGVVRVDREVEGVTRVGIS
jgi:hypothetical protein